MSNHCHIAHCLQLSTTCPCKMTCKLQVKEVSLSVSGVNVVDRRAHLPVGSSCQAPINDSDSNSVWVHGSCRKFCMQCKSATTAIAACMYSYAKLLAATC